MVDLRFHLPTALVVDGREVPIETGFRTWLKVQRCVEETGVIPPIFFIGDVPEGDWGAAAGEFLASKVCTPHGKGEGGNTLDLIRDGDYIVGSFQSAYGLDLTSPSADDMHWHRFLALLRSLPSDTKIADIVGYRSWTPARGKRKQEDAMRRLKSQWTLPPEHDARLEDWARQAFGNVEVS